MRVLGLETSTQVGTVAVLDQNQVRGEISFLSTTTHSERILQNIDQVLRGADLSPADLEGVAVGLGPGSFTGLRIGLSTAKGLAYALGIPVAGIPTLEALANNAPFWPELICAILDARRGFVYGGLFKTIAGETLKRIERDEVREVVPWVRSFGRRTLFVGDGGLTYREAIQEAMGARANFAHPEMMHPRGSIIARMGLMRIECQGGDDLDALEPLYIRRPEAAPLTMAIELAQIQGKMAR